MTLPKGIKPAVEEVADKLNTVAQRSWAACVRRVFEAWPLLRVECGTDMLTPQQISYIAAQHCALRVRVQLVAMVTSDVEVVRIAHYLGQPTGWPVMNPARPPPDTPKDETQLDSDADRWDGIQDA